LKTSKVKDEEELEINIVDVDDDDNSENLKTTVMDIDKEKEEIKTSNFSNFDIDKKELNIGSDSLDNNDRIEIKDAYENNLKHIDISIPKGKLVVFSGVSGSGKSSLVFDTVAIESNRQWQASFPLYLRNKMPHYERPKVGSIKNLTPSIVVDQKTFGASSRSSVGTAIDVAPLIRLLFSRVGKPSAGGSMAYSFNHPSGMCQECTGLGESLVLDEDRLFDEDLSLKEGAIKFSQFSNGWQTYLYQRNPLLTPTKKLKDYSDKEWKVLKYGSDKPIKIEYISNNNGRVSEVAYEGVIPRFNRLYLKRDITKLKKNLQDEIKSLVCQGHCTACNGTGLNPKALKSKINGYNIMDYTNMSVYELLDALKDIKSAIGASISKQIIYILEKMIDVGLGYLSMSRKTDTLSGGEVQRIKMVRNLGSSLTNITYVFDEPTSGLHPFDAERIGKLLINLRNNHNNVLVVEHSKQMFVLADYIIELGPEAGTRGGKIVYEGTLENMKKMKTPTALALKEKVVLNENPLPWNETFTIKNAKLHNLKNITVNIPKGVLTAITGVAGSGKSSLCEVFLKKYPNVISINQKPIGISIRSNPATYTGIMDEIRKEFAKENNVSASLFSFNSKGGCETCKGKGHIVYDMAFADSVKVICEDCNGHRYNKKALSYKYKGKNIEEVLELTIEDSISFFDKEKIKKPVQCLIDVGLGYLTLGQSTNTMSGGEIQRIKLASELHKEGQIFLLDEPSTGLHVKDIKNLLALLKKIVSQENTVIIIEHRLEMIGQADYIIDLGPNGGSEGGEVIFTGTPKELIECKESKTGAFLKMAI
jgi:excinuclease UvrABC ATPase subunit